MDYGGLCKEQRTLRDSTWGWESTGQRCGGGKKEVTGWDWDMQNKVWCSPQGLRWLDHSLHHSTLSPTWQSDHMLTETQLCDLFQQAEHIPATRGATQGFLVSAVLYDILTCTTMVQLLYGLFPLGENESGFLVNLNKASQKQQRPEVYRQFSEPWVSMSKYLWLYGTEDSGGLITLWGITWYW